MVHNSLGLYDLLVDVTPGLLFLILIAPDMLYSASGFTGLGLVLAAFVIGRLLHGLGGLIGERIAFHLDEDDIYERTWFGANWGKNRLHRSLQRTLRRTDQGVTPSSSPDEIQHFAECKVYRSQTLYHKYNILNTFYRSLTIVFTSVLILYILYLDVSKLHPDLSLLSFSIILVFLAFLSMYRMIVFEDRKRGALAYDFDIDVREGGGE